MNFRRRIPKHFAILLTVYSAGWLCIAPSLVVCICHHGDVTASRIHEQAGCSEAEHVGHACHVGHLAHHAHHHGHSHHSDEPHHQGDSDGHRDLPLLDDARIEQAPSLALDAPLAGEVAWFEVDDADAALAQPLVQQHDRGPPRTVCLALRSIVLLT